MRSWLEFAVYVVGWFVAGRLLYRYLDTSKPGSVDRAAMGFLGLFWPLIAVAAAAWFIFKMPTLGVLTTGQREERTSRMQKRIAELERELGLVNGNGKAHG